MTTEARNRSLVSKIGFGLAIAAVIALTALVLRLEGRFWICACGKVLPWVGSHCSTDTSQHFLDPYAFTHVLHGFGFFWLISLIGSRLKKRWQLLLAIVLEAAWEVFENTNFIIERYRTATAALGYTGDTVVNSLGDIVCCILGFLIAQRLGIKKSIIVFIALEIALALWIKDSLLLEILMLIRPIEAIKAWQMC